MPKLGEKFICGGREFWCIGLVPDTNMVVMQSATAVLQIPVEGLSKTFKSVGALCVGERYVAKGTFNGITAGTEYEVLQITGDTITLSNGQELSISGFAVLF